MGANNGTSFRSY